MSERESAHRTAGARDICERVIFKVSISSVNNSICNLKHTTVNVQNKLLYMQDSNKNQLKPTHLRKQALRKGSK